MNTERCPDGHVQVDKDMECLRCGLSLTTDDVVAVTVHRKPRQRYGGENQHTDDVANPEEWGGVG